jgi:4-hydroxyphenylpyruvate dioxygenase-like putative hemolysin
MKFLLLSFPKIISLCCTFSIASLCFLPYGIRRLPPDAQARPVGLTRIDHVAQVMSQEEFLTWTLFYASIFDVGKAPEVNVATLAAS